MLQSSRVLVLATLIGGTLRVIAPEEVAIEVTGAVLIGRPGAVVRGGGVGRDAGGGLGPGMPVIDIHAFALGGRVKVIRPRPPRRLNPLRRRP
jgi:hypothetical protein